MDPADLGSIEDHRPALAGAERLRLFVAQRVRVVRRLGVQLDAAIDQVTIT